LAQTTPHRADESLPDRYAAARAHLRQADPVLGKLIDGLERPPTEQELLEIAERWRPYRSLAAGYLFLSSFGANE
jgi:3-methyladenine DNA glycosylase/8-oxoguanine DNA glycosylase